jgi:hypothetical protein
MKKLAAVLCIAGSTLALAACDTTGTGDIDTEPPYATERTAGYDSEPAPAPAPQPERVFKAAQTK